MSTTTSTLAPTTTTTPAPTTTTLAPTTTTPAPTTTTPAATSSSTSPAPTTTTTSTTTTTTTTPWWFPTPSTTPEPTTSSTTTDPPLSIDGPVSHDDEAVSGDCPSGSDVWLEIAPSAVRILGGFTYDTHWEIGGLDLSGATEVRASVDQFASWVSEPVVQATTTSTAAPVTEAPGTTTTPAPTTTEAPGLPSFAIAHGGRLLIVQADGSDLYPGAEIEFTDAEVESSSVVAVADGLLAVVWHESWGGGRCRTASLGAGEVSLGGESQLEGTSGGAHGMSSAARLADGVMIAAAYADGSDCLGKVSLARVGGYQVTTTTPPPTTTTAAPTTTAPPTTPAPTTSTAAPTTTAPPTTPAPIPFGFHCASPWAPILPAPHGGLRGG